MICAWQELLSILPSWLASEVDKSGRESLQELRLRLGQAPQLKFGYKSGWLNRKVSREDLNFVINTASRYSPWASKSISQGYLTAGGGHRIGLCGEGFYREDGSCWIREVRSVCIRVARDFPGIAGGFQLPTSAAPFPTGSSAAFGAVSASTRTVFFAGNKAVRWVE